MLFRWENRSDHSLGKWYAKFRTGKFCPGISFTICTNQFHLSKKRPRGNETDGFVEMEHEFPFGIFCPEKQETFSDVPLERPKKSCFNRVFRKPFCNNHCVKKRSSRAQRSNTSKKTWLSLHTRNFGSD